jgi:hypothetical protein
VASLRDNSYETAQSAFLLKVIELPLTTTNKREVLQSEVGRPVEIGDQ